MRNWQRPIGTGMVIVSFLALATLTYLWNRNAFFVTILGCGVAIGLVVSVFFAARARKWIEAVWWPRFVEAQMMKILGNSAQNLYTATERPAIPAVTLSPLKNAILEATHDLRNTRETLVNAERERERLRRSETALYSLVQNLIRILNALADSQSTPDIRQVQQALGPVVVISAALGGLQHDPVLRHWSVLGSAAKQVLGWHHQRQEGKILPDRWVEAIVAKILEIDGATETQPPAEA